MRKTPVDADPPYYHRVIDFERLCRDYPPARAFDDLAARLTSQEVRRTQERRFLEQVARAWQIPFYREHWGRAGLQPADIRSLDDLQRIPPFSVSDLKESLAANSPWGGFSGIDPDTDAPMPLVFHTSGGTTGIPRPMFFAPQDREVMAIMGSRRFYGQGVRPFDRVLVTLALGLPNAGMLARESLWKYTGAVPIMSGTGANTPTQRQIALIRTWRVNVLAGLGAYLRHMAAVARDDLGIAPASLGVERIIGWLGNDDRQALEAEWDCDVYDGYGTNELGTVAADCLHKSGMHVYEDAFLPEICDRDTLAPVAEGRGVLVITSLFKHAAPMLRFNTNDISAFVPGGCACGRPHRRLAGVFARADNMVKLRGTNVFPEAVGALLAGLPGFNGEYVCVVDRDERGRDRMTVRAEMATQQGDAQASAQRLLADALGVRVDVELGAPGSLAALTLVDSAGKPRRLRDERTASRTS